MTMISTALEPRSGEGFSSLYRFSSSVEAEESTGRRGVARQAASIALC